MKKIFIEKGETVASVLEKIFATADNDIILVVPKNAALKGSAGNFRLLQREADGAQKRLTVESVDDEVLALAASSNLHASHPLFRGERGAQALSDIVAAGREVAAGSAQSSPEEEGTAGAEAVELREKQLWRQGTQDASAREAPREETPAYAPSPKKRLSRWFIVCAVFGIVAVAAAGGALAMGRFFSWAEVAVNLKKTPWNFENAFSADKSLTRTSFETRTFPAEVFMQQRTTTQFFPASGVATVSQKAAGTITVYNSFSSQPQVLVATTRFATADGSIFRLAQQITVPGAKVSDGKIIPSSIEASVTADKPGAEYNRKGEERLTIPGFKGTPRYEGFYGVLKETSGGFVGQKKVPTDADVASARDKTTEILKSSLQSAFFNNRPRGFVIADGMSEVVIDKLTVNRSTDEGGNFSVFGAATFRAFGFKEEDVRSFLERLAGDELEAAGIQGPLVFQTLDVKYAQAKPDFGKGRVNFILTARGEAVRKFSPEEFRDQSAGKKVEEVRSAIAALSGLSDGKISIWPFWVRTLPSDTKRISVTVR
jgi:hypothetical protein